MTDDGWAMTMTGTFRTSPMPVLRAAVFAMVGVVLGVSAHHLVAEGPVPWRRGSVAGVVLFAVGLVGHRAVPAPARPASVLAWWRPPPCGRAVLADVVIRRGPPQAGALLTN